jgi:hypothetical protein
MKRETLLKRLKALGYPLLEPEDNLVVNETLAALVESRDLRLWEGFPLVLANGLKKDLFDYDVTEKMLKKKDDKAYFQKLVLMSVVLYGYLGLELSSLDRLSASRFREQLDENVCGEYLEKFRKDGNLESDLKGLSCARIKNTFKHYFGQTEVDFGKYTQMRDEFALEYALSQVFSKKQKTLFMKKLKGERMSKTEREYYSRSVRKKVSALANEELHKLAARLAKR